MSRHKNFERRFRILEPSARLGKISTLRDQFSTLVLQGISSVPDLANTLALKGAGALRQCYFENARLTNDLDFSALPGYSDIIPLTYRMGEAACFIRKELLSSSDLGIGYVTAERVNSKAPLPVPMDQFVFKFESTSCEIKVLVEVATDEVVLRRTPLLPLMRASSDSTYCGQIRTYDLDELVAEKLRAILQWQAQVRQGRSQFPIANAYFDLWWLFHKLRKPFDSNFVGLFQQKCAVRGVEYRHVVDFFGHDLVNYATYWWQVIGMNGLVATLPDSEELLHGASQLVANWLNMPLMDRPAWVPVFRRFEKQL